MTETDEIESALAKGEQVTATELAKGHVPNAIEVLAAGMKEAPWNVRKDCAKQIIEIAEGRPQAKKGEKGDGSINVVIKRMVNIQGASQLAASQGTAIDISAATIAALEAGAAAMDVVDGPDSDLEEAEGWESGEEG